VKQLEQYWDEMMELGLSFLICTLVPKKVQQLVKHLGEKLVMALGDLPRKLARLLEKQ